MHAAGDKSSTRPLINSSERNLERTSNSSRSAHPTGQVLKSEGETSIF